MRFTVAVAAASAQRLPLFDRAERAIVLKLLVNQNARAKHVALARRLDYP